MDSHLPSVSSPSMPSLRPITWTSVRRDANIVLAPRWWKHSSWRRWDPWRFGPGESHSKLREKKLTSWCALLAKPWYDALWVELAIYLPGEKAETPCNLPQRNQQHPPSTHPPYHFWRHRCHRQGMQFRAPQQWVLMRAWTKTSSLWLLTEYQPHQ